MQAATAWQHADLEKHMLHVCLCAGLLQALQMEVGSETLNKPASTDEVMVPIYSGPSLTSLLQEGFNGPVHLAIVCLAV